MIPPPDNAAENFANAVLLKIHFESSTGRSLDESRWHELNGMLAECGYETVSGKMSAAFLKYEIYEGGHNHRRLKSDSTLGEAPGSACEEAWTYLKRECARNALIMARCRKVDEMIDEVEQGVPTGFQKLRISKSYGDESPQALLLLAIKEFPTQLVLVFPQLVDAAAGQWVLCDTDESFGDWADSPITLKTSSDSFSAFGKEIGVKAYHMFQWPTGFSVQLTSAGLKAWGEISSIELCWHRKMEL